MANSAVWRLDEPERGEADDGAHSQLSLTAVERSHLDLEKHLEGWIAADAKLIGGGLTIVGRQVHIDDGILDLLAIDSQDRWLVIEIKVGMLQSGALDQALYYASSLARLSADDLLAKLEGGLGTFGDEEMLSARLKQLLQSEREGERRDIAMMLVGVGVSAGLERVKEFLGRFDVPITIVNFEVFKLAGGPKLLIREVIEEEETDVAVRSRPRRTVEMIRSRAVAENVLEPFNRFVRMSEEADLAVRPFVQTVMIAPRAHRGRFLMYATPRSGGMHIAVGPGAFVEFFDVKEEVAVEALRPGDVDQFLVGEALDARLDQVERFLREDLQRPQPNRSPVD